MELSNVCFVVAGTIMVIHQLLFDHLGGFDTNANPMSSGSFLICYGLIAIAAFAGWRMRKWEEKGRQQADQSSTL